MNKNKKRNIFLDIILICILLFIFIMTFFLINNIIYNKFINSKNELLNEFKKLTGFTLNYNSLSPNIIGSIKVNEVNLTDDETNINLGDVEISYSLFSYLKNQKNPFSIITKVSLNSLNLAASKDDITAKFEMFRKKFSKADNGKETDLKFDNLEIEFNKCNFVINDNTGTYVINLDSLEIFVNEEIKIRSKLRSKIDISKVVSIYFDLYADGVIYDIESLDTIFNFDFNTFEINSTGIKKQQFEFTSKNGNFKFERLKDLLPVKFSIEKKGDVFSSDIEMKDLMTRNIVISSNRNSMLIEKINFRNNMTYDLKNKLLNGILNFNLPLQELSVFKNIVVTSDINVKDNLIAINDISIIDDNRENVVSLKGQYPLYKADFDINLKLKDLKLPSTKLNADFNISKRNNYLTVLSDFFLINGIDLGQFALKIEEMEKDRYLIGTMKEFNGYSFNGEIYNKNDNLIFILDHKLNGFNFKPIINAYNSNFNDDYFLSGNFNTIIDKNGVTMNETDFILNDKKSLSTVMPNGISQEKTTGSPDKNDVLASFKVGIKDGVLRIPALIVPRYNISSSGKIDLKNNLMTANLNAGQYAYDIRSSFSKEKINLAVNENELEAIFNPAESYLYINARDFALPYRDMKVTSSFIYDLQSRRIFENYINVKNLRIFPEETGNIDAKMSYENNILKFYDLVYSDKQNRITGIIENQFNTTGNFGLYTNGFLKDDGKGESYSINIKLNENNIDGKFQIAHMDIRKLIKGNTKGYLNLRFSLMGDILNPDIDLDGEIAEGRLSNSPLKGLFSIKKIENKLLLKRINLQLGKSRVYLSNSEIVFGEDDSANINIAGNITLDGLSKILKTDFYVKGLYTRIEGGNNNSLFSSLIEQFGLFSSGDSAVNPINLDIGFDNINLFYLNDINIVKQEKFAAVKFNLSRNDNMIIFKNYGPKFVYFTLENDDIALKFYDKDETVFNAEINTAGGDLKGKLVFKKFPVNCIERVIIPYVDIEDGYLDGTITLKGRTDNPEYYGRLYVYYGVVSIPTYLLDKIQNISGIIIADKNKILVNNVNGNVRTGNAHGYGEVVFNGWNFENYTFHVNSEEVPAYVKIGPVDARGIAYVEDFIFDGGKEQNFNFIATLGVTQAEVNLASLMGIEGSGKVSKLPVLPINVIMNFKAGDKVKVNYPLIKGYIEKGNVFTLKYIGLEPNVYLGGQINMNRGEIYYFNKSFKIEQSTFKFDENDPRINPLVNVKSYYRTRDSRGEQVKIILNLNERLLSFKTSLSSLPFKTQDELNGLLGVSIATNSETEKTGVNAVNSINSEYNPQNIDSIINTTNYISNAFLFSPIENNIRRITTLDTFTLKTGFFGNILKQNSNFIDLLDNSNLSVGKYVSNEIYLGSMMTFNKMNDLGDRFFYTFPDNKYGLNLQLMLQVELPYISFGYSYVPKEVFKSGDHVISMELNFKF